VKQLLLLVLALASHRVLERSAALADRLNTCAMPAL
jgi:hypothetical protein